MKNKKTRLIALLLAANLLTFGAMPTIFAVGDEAGAGTEASQQAANRSYKLCTEEVGDRTVKVYLQLNAAASESVCGYQTTLRLTDSQGSVVPGREAEFSFDRALADVRIKQASFDKETQLLQIYVAADKDLVQVDENNSLYTLLPIGTIHVPVYNSIHEFRILLSGPTGNTAFVDSNFVQHDLQYTEEVDGNGVVQIISPIAVQGETYGTPAPTPTPTAEPTAEPTVEPTIEPTAEPSETPGVATYTVTVVGDNAAIEGTDEKSKAVASRSGVTVHYTPADGETFSYWKDENDNIMSLSPVYTFAAVGDVTLTAVTNAEEPISASVSIRGAVTKLENGKFRLSYIGNCVLPEGCAMVSHGIVYTNKDIETVNSDLDNFVIDGGSDAFRVAQSEVKGTSVQFIANIRNVVANRSRTARAYMKYTDAEGVEQTVYSAPFALTAAVAE